MPRKCAASCSNKFQARLQIQLVATQQGLQGQPRLPRRHPLAQPRLQMRILAQGIEFAREQLIQVRLGHPRFRTTMVLATKSPKRCARELSSEVTPPTI